MATPGSPRVLLAGGGTGGHLFPGIAVARELLRRHPDGRVSVAGTERGLEARVVPREGFVLEQVRSQGLVGRSRMAKLRGLATLPLSFWDAWWILRRQRPHLVVGLGGYSSGPLVLLAAALRVPTLLLEQNAVPGVTNRLLAPFVRAAAVSFEATLPFFRGKGFVSGNPVRRGRRWCTCWCSAVPRARTRSTGR
jgi:UDP-N-acetylglucosamine--N-acetylmuramyl-(pentapeptide) pyrophosphoryl-undecaprenol N-acetylglucosamine transferase